MHLTFRNEVYRVLTTILKTPGVDSAGLATVLNRSRTEIKRCVEQLERAKIVRREDGPVLRHTNQAGLVVGEASPPRWFPTHRSIIAAMVEFDKKFPVIALTGELVYPLAFFIYSRRNTAEGVYSQLAAICPIGMVKTPQPSPAGYRVELTNVTTNQLDKARKHLASIGYVSLGEYPPVDELPVHHDESPVCVAQKPNSVAAPLPSNVTELLESLRVATTPADKRRIRSKLRAAGHRGGLGS